MSLVDLGKQLLESAKNGETEEVRQLMTSGAPFTTDWLGTSPLHMAAQYGHLATAEVLLRAGISRDARTKVDRTPLHVAAQEGHLEIVELLLKHGADIEAKDMLKMTPLHWAVERSHVHVIDLLLKYGADINACSKFEKSPIDIAMDNERDDVIQLLQDYLTNPTKRKEPSEVPDTTYTIPVTTATKTITVMPKQLPVRDVTTTITVQSQSPQTKAVTKPLYIQAKLPTIARSVPANKTTVVTSEDGSIDQGSTSVLATLAALAEATAPNATITSTEAFQWLETHGITMLPSDNSTIVASAIEGGQTISLTDAGKLALNLFKDSHAIRGADGTSPDSVNSVASSISNSTNQKVIAIVTDQSQIPSIIPANQAPFVVVSGGTLKNTEEEPESHILLTKSPEDITKEEKAQESESANGKIILKAETADQEKDKLQKELEAVRRQAEEYKAQLQKKEHEAEVYRKQLEQMKNVTKR